MSDPCAVIAEVLRSFGLSDADAGQYELTEVAADILTALRDLPVAERMEAMGMIPVHLDRDCEPYYDGMRLPSSVMDDLWTVLND